MQVLAINSSPLKARGNTEIIMQEFVKGLKSAGAKVEVIYLQELKINPCLGKLICWIKTPGICCQNDDMTELLSKLKRADIWVLASPLYWDGVTGKLKNMLDRLLPMLEPFIELENGHCRHMLRPEIKNGKIVLITSCGFWELDNFEPAVAHIQAVSKNAHRKFAGALLRPHGALLKYMVDKDDDTFKDVLTAAQKAGEELMKTGKISPEILSRVSQELMPCNEYMKILNNNFHSLINKYKK